MPRAPTYNGNSNPNAKGGAFGYDGRTGLGIGSLGGDPNSGIGRNWNMGDALSSPKSEYDYDEYKEEDFRVTSGTTIKDLVLFAGLINSEEEFDEFEAGIEAKSHSSFHRGATDSLAHRGGDISSLGGLGNSMAGVIGLSAGKKLNGDIMTEEMLKQYIREVMINEARSGYMSGSIYVRSGGKGSMYKNAMSSTNTADAAPVGHLPTSRSGVNNKGYGQKKIKVKIKKVAGGYEDIETMPTTDGAETLGAEKLILRRKKAEDSFDRGESTFEELMSTTKKEDRDQENVDFYSRF